MLNTKPPGQVTGYAHPDCYARALRDCSTDMNREHYISRKLLEKLEDFEAEGFAWRPKKGPVGVGSLCSFVLCKRHNAALSPLDNNITELYDLMRRWQNREPVGVLTLDGEDLERWALKVMSGTFASGSARFGGIKAKSVDGNTIAMPKRHMQILFGDAAVRPPDGYYYAHQEFEDFRPVSVRCRADAIGGKPTPNQIVVAILGFTWITSLARRAPYGPKDFHRYRTDDAFPKWNGYRPSEFIVGTTGHLTLRWNGVVRTEAPTVTLYKTDVKGRRR